MKFFLSVSISILFWALGTTPAAADIIQTDSMEEALQYAKRQDLVVFDIDNTILEPNQTLGSDQWYGYILTKYLQVGMDEDKAIDHAIKDWIPVQQKTNVRAVEASTPRLIRGLQKRGISVMALTARPLQLAEETIDQLESIEVRLHSRVTAFKSHGEIKYHKGVLFAGPRNNKGLALANFLQEENLNPRKIVFIDDKEKHVKNMEEIMTQIQVSSINVRYSAADFRVKEFSAKVADLQWKHFLKYQGELMSDDEARRVAN